MSKFRFPTAYTILFGLIIVAAASTWVIPAGEYDLTFNPAIEKEVPVPGTYQEVPSNPQGIGDIFLAPIAGLYDPVSNNANAVDVAVFVLIIGGFLMVVTKTGAIDASLARVMVFLKGREAFLIPILMGVLAAGGTIFGLAEETLAFYSLVMPVMLRAGYDAVTGAAVIIIGAGVGVYGATVNPFATVIASNAAGVPFTDGIELRLITLGVGFVLAVAWVLRYAIKVKRNPEASLVADKREEIEAHFLHNSDPSAIPTFTKLHAVIMVIFVGAFAMLVYGVSALGWWMGEMSAMFLAASVLVGLVTRMGEAEFVDTFVEGARDLLGVALIIGVARGIVVVMDAGSITATLLHWSENAVQGLSSVTFINVIFWIEFLLTFFVPSTSGLAVLTMPIMAPLAGFAGVPADLIVTAYQSASGIVNLIVPTSAVVMGGLAIARVPYDRWLRFTMPLVVMLTVLTSILISVSV
ncbi:YfcC family protein [Rhodobacteraceae bacterium RKSG542]|uniref:YfcC family protein n=1 Tax=Pseudovibrio flavus TaxID=2529854 RepID=UPI0012BB8547|nr:YfcC family protein [Pseudovibrio flavus]MTI16320.1 YfcC family protein [Pseudovibrio flavus]